LVHQREIWLTQDEGSGDSAYVSRRRAQYGGGDYLGLAADAPGVFHPFWPDMRSGVQHIYTAAIRVEFERSRCPAARRSAAFLLCHDRLDILGPPRTGRSTT
jgi:hypothetical protein